MGMEFSVHTRVDAGGCELAAAAIRRSPPLNWKGEMSALTSSAAPIERLRSEIAQLEARYDGIFPPGVYAVLEDLKRKLAALHKAT